ncbi:MAG TPA: DUF5117 domain-containing protein, partial [Niastella sp.]|nr:DUF5117 domain-containing protein [Niastella sp.]
MRKTLLLLSTALVIASMATAQRKTPTPQPSDTTKKTPAATGQAMPGTNRGGAPKAGPKPYGEVITAKAISRKGMLSVHKVEDRHFFEIPDSLIGRDILAVCRISRSAAGARAQMLGYAGDQVGDNVIRFEKGPDDRIFLRSISYKEMSSDTTENGMYTSVLNSNLQPIVGAFDVKAYNKDNGTVVIDVT